jgi:DNA-binding NtrC family response regulator
MRTHPKILLVEDDETLAAPLQSELELKGYAVRTADQVERGLEAARQEDFEVVVTDLQLPDSSGLEIVKALHCSDPRLPVILMTGHHTAEAAIKATRLGAYEYLVKPFKIPELVDLVEKAVGARRLMSEPVEVGETKSAQDAIIGRSRGMVEVYKAIGLVSAKPVSVLIRGETGTGKELVARYLYQHSERAGRALIVVNCPAIPDNLLESELFGHEAGAFTDATSRRIGRFEQANGGTIFLDEIGDISLGTQAKLLRVLQDKVIQRVGGGKEGFPVDVRVIAATHRDLERAVEEKQFRRDLYYRLNDAVIRLPPLRDRQEDIPDLVSFFLQQHAAELGAIGSTIDSEGLRLLQLHPWPGNVRELRNAVRKALLLAHGRPIDPGIIKRALDETKVFRRTPAQHAAPPSQADSPLAVHVSKLLDSAALGERQDVAAALTEWAERDIYSQAIALAEGDQTKAARWLGVSRVTMRERLLRYNLRPARERVREEPLL